MRIFIKAKTGAKETKVVEPEMKLIPDDEPIYTVHVKERPVEGRANEAILKLPAEHFGVARSQVRLVSGATSRRKVFEIMGL